MTQTQKARRSDRRRMMLEEPVAKVIPLLAIPMIIAMLIDSVYNFTDTFFVSQLGTAATAAVGVNSSLMHLIRSLAMGFGIGGSSYISRLLGAKREDFACKVASTTVFSAMGAITVIAIIAFVFIQPLVVFLGATETILPYSIQYARWILVSSPFTVGTVVLGQLLRSEGSPKYSMIGMVSGCIINIGLDPLFINVLGLGVAGAAIATGISKFISFSILLAPYIMKKAILEIKLKLFTPKKEIYLEVAKMGIPAFLKTSMLSLSSIAINNVAGNFGDAALAAVTVANKSMRLVASALLGLSQGFQPVAGFCWGAKKYKRIKKAFFTTGLMGTGAAIVLGISLALNSKGLMGIFTPESDPEIIAIGSYMIIAQCITLIFHVWAVLTNGLFQALGKAVGATILAFARQGLCLIPTVFILSKVFGLYGLASAQAASDVLTFILAVPMVLYLFKKISMLKEPAQEDSKEIRQDNAAIKEPA